MQSWGLWRRPEPYEEEPMLTQEQLLKVMPNAAKRVDAFLKPLNDALDRYEINTLMRKAAFLANAAHESGELRWMEEIWGPTPAQRGYEGRTDLGNVEPGDGHLFRGRGIFQLTGRKNYAVYSQARFGDYRLLMTPDDVARPELACDSAGWFWQMRKLNELADAGDFRAVVRKINGGYNGITERTMYYERGLQVL